ncbi:MAG: hypothetical protein J0I06_15125 [Planctomycetes bacterium]|nr:hypothetical protein [Planctomycetota bacterium]
MTRIVQIVPHEGVNLYSLMVQKVRELSESKQGAFSRSGAKMKDRAKWKHKTYKGWIKLQRSACEVIVAEVKSLSQADDHWQLLHAFMGWLDRHFYDQILSINITYRGEAE